MFVFKQVHPFEKRCYESERIRKKYPDRIPVIVEMVPNSQVPVIPKNKFLVPNDMTVGQFIFVIRNQIKLKQDQAIFIFVNNTLPPASYLMSQVYSEHADKDGFLYMLYSGESTFG